jgi:hypothetical protein
MRLRVGRIAVATWLAVSTVFLVGLVRAPAEPPAVVRSGLPCASGDVLEGAGALFTAESALAPDAFVAAARCGTLTAPDEDRIPVLRAGKAVLARSEQRADEGDVTGAVLDTLEVAIIGHELASAGGVIDLAVGTALRDDAIAQLARFSDDPGLPEGTARLVAASLATVTSDPVDYAAVLAREERASSVWHYGWREVPWRLVAWPRDWWDWRVAGPRAARTRTTTSTRVIPSLLAEASRIEAADRALVRDVLGAAAR